jgi:hypothetical protein
MVMVLLVLLLLLLLLHGLGEVVLRGVSSRRAE